MISGIISFIGGSALSVLGLLLALLPTIDVSSLPVAVPDWIVGALGMINYFVPISMMITIITVWAAAVLAINVVMLVTKLLKSVR